MPRLSNEVIPDEQLRVMPGMMLVEPIRPGDRLKLANIILTVVPEELPGTLKARVIKFGKLDKDPGFSVGDMVEITPHAGYLIQSIKGVHERMTISIKEAIGVWDEDDDETNE